MSETPAKAKLPPAVYMSRRRPALHTLCSAVACDVCGATAENGEPERERERYRATRLFGPAFSSPTSSRTPREVAASLGATKAYTSCVCKRTHDAPSGCACATHCIAIVEPFTVPRPHQLPLSRLPSCTSSHRSSHILRFSLCCCSSRPFRRRRRRRHRRRQSSRVCLLVFASLVVSPATADGHRQRR